MVYGFKVRAMRFFIFGGLTNISASALKSAAQELNIALAGPAVTLAIAGLLLSLSTLGKTQGYFMLLTSLVGRINLFLTIVNLLPVFPFDGGRALRAILWKVYSDYHRATQNVRAFAKAVAYGLMVLGISLCGLYRLTVGAILVLIGWRLNNLLIADDDASVATN
jgi:Zn-dependent protease